MSRRLIQDPDRPPCRLARGWSSAEMERRLVALRGQPVTAEPDAPEGTRYCSQAIIAREPAGPPVHDGPFTRARELVRRYDFSDPRIVTGHFDRAADLLGRVMLLEIGVLGLRFLCGVVVAEVRNRVDARQTVWGFRYDTLVSHIGAGSEWFLLSKDHDTGEIQFRIEAHWRMGRLPNWWSRVGWKLLAPRYQRAWHRLAYIRLRSRLDARGLPALPRGERLVHVGAPLPAPPVELLAGPTPPPEIDIEEVIVDERARVPVLPFVPGEI